MEDVGKVRFTGLGVEGLGSLPNWTGGMWMYLGGERGGTGSELVVGFHYVVGVFLMLLSSDGLLQVSSGPLRIGFVS